MAAIVVRGGQNIAAVNYPGQNMAAKFCPPEQNLAGQNLA